MFASLLSPAVFALALLTAPATPPAAAPRPAPRATAPAHPAFTVTVTGQGSPVVFIPGLNCPGQVWAETVARYRGQHRCYVVALAGFGGEPAQLLPAVRDQLLAYFRAEKLHRPLVVGHSLGGFLALWLAETDPAAVGPLEIVDSLPFLPAATNPAATAAAMQPQAEQLRQQVSRGHLPLAAQRQVVAALVTDTARVTQVARWGLASDPATTGQAMYEMYTTDLRPALGRVQQPVLVLGSWAGYQQYGATKASTQAVFAQQYAALPHRTLVLSEAGRHFLMYDDPTWFFTQTDAFLKQPAVAAR